MDDRAKQLISDGDYLYGMKEPLNSFHQVVAENFYPQRADFTSMRSLGRDFANNLTTSYPLIAGRDLGNTLSTMLRPTGKQWNSITTRRSEIADKDLNARRWLEWATTVQNSAMYDKSSQFTRATKEGDHDFVFFGQTCVSTEVNRRGDSLLYRSHHLRDVCWCENDEGKIGKIHVKWKPALGVAAQKFDTRGTMYDSNPAFGGVRRYGLHKAMRDALDAPGGAYIEVNLRHVVIPSDEYEYNDPGTPGGKKKWRTPYVAVWIDVQNMHVLEEAGSWTQIYTIPRWQTVSGTQYAYSPAVVAALPDARLIQAQTLVLLEAGEKAVNPPMIATEEAVRSDINIAAGGYTWVQKDYDERWGESLRPIPADYSGLPFGHEMQQDTREMIAQAFFLNKIAMPPPDKAMTAYEVAQRIEEYVRNVMPLFEPVEAEYNAPLCEQSFELLLRGGTFGSVDDMPQVLRGQDIQFKFQSPLTDALGQQKAGQFSQVSQILAQAFQMDPTIAQMVNLPAAVRDVLNGMSPATWLRSPEEFAQIQQQAQQKAQIQQTINTAHAGGQAAQSVGDGVQAVAEAQQAAA